LLPTIEAGFGSREDDAKLLDDIGGEAQAVEDGDMCGGRYTLKGQPDTLKGDGIVINVLTDSSAARLKVDAFLKQSGETDIVVFAYQASGSTVASWGKAMSKFSHVTVYTYTGARRKNPNPTQQPGVELVTALCVSLSRIPFGANTIHLAFDDKTEILPARNLRKILHAQLSLHQPLSVLQQNRNCSTPSDWHDLMVLALRRGPLYGRWIRRFMKVVLAHSQRKVFPLNSPRLALQESLRSGTGADQRMHSYIDPQALCSLPATEGSSCALHVSCHEDAEYCSSGKSTCTIACASTYT
jgi:hypothetical protein